MARILLADDHDDIRQLVVLQLQKRGFEVLSARNGLEALELLVSSPPQLVLMDLNMPVLDGWEAIGRMRCDPVLCTIPVIALTAYAHPGDRARAKSAGCADHHAKPIDFEVLHAQVLGLLANQSLDKHLGR